MRAILLFLALVTVAVASPRKRAGLATSPFQAQVVIVAGPEYPGLLGATGAPPHTLDFEAMRIFSIDGTIRRLWFNVELASIGGRAFNPVAVNASRVAADPDFYGLPTLVDFFRFSLVDASGNVRLQKVTSTSRLLWDQVALLPFTRQAYSVGMPGIGIGRAAILLDGLAETFLDYTEEQVPDGDYILRLESDQDNAFGVYNRLDIYLRIDAFQITLRPPPVTEKPPPLRPSAP